MSETPDRDPEPSERPDDPNPHSEELDVEGPNESAPGHAPTAHGDERTVTPPREPDR